MKVFKIEENSVITWVLSQTEDEAVMHYMIEADTIYAYIDNVKELTDQEVEETIIHDDFLGKEISLKKFLDREDFKETITVACSEF